MSVVDLPVIEVAAYVHHGPMDDIGVVYEAVVAWIVDSGYPLAGRSRKLYHEWHDDNPILQVTEIQLPITHTN